MPDSVVRRLGLLFLCLTALIGSVAPGTAAAADAPVPQSPLDGTVTTAINYPPLGIPELAWLPVANATSYRLQLSQDIGFATLIAFTTPHTRYTPTNVSQFPEGAWYWRVRVEAPVAGPYSSVMSFTKQWASAENAPALLAPSDTAGLDFFEQSAFSWQPVAGAASYRLQIATCGGFTSPILSVTSLATTYQPLVKLSNGDYCWRVVPLDPAGRDGTPSIVRQFTVSYDRVPALLEPADGATPTFTPSMRWSAVRGAEFYRLQYSTDETLNTAITQVDTRNTTYTPIDNLSNDVNYYWRVQAHSGNSVSGWSEIRRFMKKWYLQAELLTPNNNYGYVIDPFFSWSPVAGAKYYKIEINCSNGFPPAPCGWTVTTSNPFYYLQPEGNKWLSPYPTVWYWQVTPYDHNDNRGKPSDTASFRYAPGTVVPQLISPLYYYPPAAELQLYEDRTAGQPLFAWTRQLIGSEQAAAYRLQVSDDPLFETVDWTVDTENLAAAPLTGKEFTAKPATDYHWRMRALDAVGGTELGEWSQIWRTRIDATAGLTPTAGTVPNLLRPTVNSEWVETTPVMEWQPLQAADGYEVEISTDAAFGGAYQVAQAIVGYPLYIPVQRLRYDGDPAHSLPYGAYYWRVRALAAGVPLGGWSSRGQFQVAAQSAWLSVRALGDGLPRPLIASDPVGDMTDPDYDVSTLYAAQSKNDWFFGFKAQAAGANMRYVLYLDLDHVDGSGADADARTYAVSTIPAHRPEYAIYVLRDSGSFSPAQVAIYRWNSAGHTWASPQTLAGVLGDLSYDAATGYLELRIPNTAIGMQETTGSAAVSLFTVQASGGHAQDTVPSDPAVAFTTLATDPGASVLSRFTSVSDHLSLVAPSTDTASGPTSMASVLPFAWQSPTGDSWLAWHGFDFQAALDSQFTSVIAEYKLRSTVPTLAPPDYTHKQDFNGNNTYYWRVRQAYDKEFTGSRGGWSSPFRFERSGLVPQGLTTTVSFATPTFGWGQVEGAESYDLQVDGDPNFGSLDVSINTARNSYTPLSTLANGVYYWRVQARRYGNIANGWTARQTLNLGLPQPSGLTHTPPGVVGRAPTLCWDPLIASANGAPVLAAWKYRVQVSRDPTFSSTYDSVDTEQACRTPVKGYDDGTYYWRVAMIDGSGKLGNYSAVAEFIKQYPIATLIAPLGGSVSASTPTFSWLPVDGAAGYKFEVSQYSTFTPLYDSVTTHNARYTPTKTYLNDKTYYWRIAVVDKDGKLGPFNGAIVILDRYPYQVYLPLATRGR